MGIEHKVRLIDFVQPRDITVKYETLRFTTWLVYARYPKDLEAVLFSIISLFILFIYSPLLSL
jgi:hypothetical protein